MNIYYTEHIRNFEFGNMTLAHIYIYIFIYLYIFISIKRAWIS